MQNVYNSGYYPCKSIEYYINSYYLVLKFFKKTFNKIINNSNGMLDYDMNVL
jgi:hypothetical protein